MKTNNNPTSGKRLAQLLALCLLATFSSCDRDGTESVEFGVNVQTPDAVYAGQPVTFEFDGNPDYIAFYSGEKNDRYANRDRTTLPEVDSLGLSYSAKMQYAENYDYLGDRILRVKGLVSVVGEERPRVVHCVQHVRYPDAALPAWPADYPQHDSRLVFIVRNFQRDYVEKAFAMFCDATPCEAPA